MLKWCYNFSLYFLGLTPSCPRRRNRVTPVSFIFNGLACVTRNAEMYIPQGRVRTCVRVCVRACVCMYVYIYLYLVT